MTGKKTKILAAVVLVLIILVQMAIPLSAGAATNVNELKSKYAELEKKQAALKQKIADSKGKIEEQEEYKATLDEQISVVQDQVNTLNSRIELLDQEIEEKSGEISEHETDISDSEELLKKRLRALYITGDPSGLALILSADTVTDMFDKTDAMRRIAEHDSGLIGNLREAKAAIETQRESIQSSRNEVAESRKELSKKESELASLVDESNSVIKSLESVKAATEEEAKKVSQEMASVDKEIDAWFAEYERKQAEKRKKQKDDPGNDDSNDNSDAPYFSGEFDWPVPGYYHVSSPFGPRWGRMHKGIDIAGGGIHGKSIVAAASGRVIHTVTYNNSGYGYYMIIDHGNGYSTLYGHCSAINVSTGQTVSRGQAIGRVGNTGRSTGPHLHFEIRVNGVAKNPMNWF